MIKHYTGGSAFPVPMSPQSQINQGGEPFQVGMTLRDWFAGQALNGLLAQSGGTAVTSTAAFGAAWAYQMADAMIAERAKPYPTPSDE